MRLQALLNGIEILETNAPMDMEISGVRYSSRDVVPGDLFVALIRLSVMPEWVLEDRLSLHL